MHLAELMVVYLAYGAPFGVYEVTCIRKNPSFADIHLIAAKFVFWPVVVASWIYKWFLRGQDYRVADLEHEIDAIRNNLESIAFGDRSAAAILQFREIFARYTGLTLVMRYRTSQGSHPRIGLGVREPSKATVACNYRHDHQRMAFHQQRARREFLEIIGRISKSQPDNEDLILKSIELAMVLNDLDCSQSLSAMLPGDREKRICNPISAPNAAN